ncbi:MAG: HAD family hydrolase [Acholeplasmataceae bacterium]|nr:HAD family hydrolase [Acholeplasmataceae bacterium]
MIKGIIFDMDGTILNTLEDIKISVNHALKIKNLPEKTDEDIRFAVGNGAFKLIERVTPKSYTLDEIKEVFQIYQAHYDQNSSNHTGPYPGILELLKALKKQKIKLAVCSNKFEHIVEELNVKMFLNLFDASVGEVKGIPIKPAPDMVYKALDILGLTKEEVLYVGDSEVDMDTASNALVKSVGVTWGYRKESLLREHNADYIIHHPNQLLEIIKGENKA